MHVQPLEQVELFDAALIQMKFTLCSTMQQHATSYIIIESL